MDIFFFKACGSLCQTHLNLFQNDTVEPWFPTARHAETKRERCVRLTRDRAYLVRDHPNPIPFIGLRSSITVYSSQPKSRKSNSFQNGFKLKILANEQWYRSTETVKTGRPIPNPRAKSYRESISRSTDTRFRSTDSLNSHRTQEYLNYRSTDLGISVDRSRHIGRPIVVRTISQQPRIIAKTRVKTRIKTILAKTKLWR